MGYRPISMRPDWQLKFAWLPHTCESSGERIWLKYGRCWSRMITGPGEPVFESHWLTTESYLLLQLKVGASP